jgi:hypothetical protein
VVICCLILSSGAQGAAKKPNKTSAKTAVQSSGLKIEKPSEKWQWLKQHTSVSAFIATGDTISSNNASVGGEGGWSQAAASPSFGLQIQLAEKKWNSISWFSTMSVEQDHELSTLTTGTSAGIQTRTLSAKPSFRPVIASVGLIYHPSSSQKFYFPVSLNYSLLNEVRTGDLASFSVRGEIGWQAGFGFTLKKQLSVEMAWRQVNYHMTAVDQSANEIDLGSQAFGGLLLSGRYWF